MSARFVACASVLAAIASTASHAARDSDSAKPASFPDCLDRFSVASGDGEPLLDRRPARPDDASAWYAVDRRDNGCPVLVKMGNPADVRPAAPARLQTGTGPGADHSR